MNVVLDPLSFYNFMAASLGTSVTLPTLCVLWIFL